MVNPLSFLPSSLFLLLLLSIVNERFLSKTFQTSLPLSVTVVGRSVMISDCRVGRNGIHKSRPLYKFLDPAGNSCLPKTKSQRVPSSAALPIISAAVNKSMKIFGSDCIWLTSENEGVIIRGGNLEPEQYL